MKVQRIDTWGADSIVVENIPPGFVLYVRHDLGVVRLVFERIDPTMQGALPRPESPGVDIDAVHRKLQGGNKP